MYWDATYRITTPLFMGGADTSAEIKTELRPPSLKGLLRFWFRAIALPILKKCEEVKQLEDEIFGSTKKQSAFLLTIENQEGITEKKSANWRNNPGMQYLGHGVTDFKGKTLRPFLEPGGSFTIRLRTKKGAPEKITFYMPLTLQALGLFGAAGARSRKGFGSLSLESLIYNGKNVWRSPTTIEELRNSQKTLLNKIGLSTNSNSLPEYTAFSRQSRIWIAKTGTDAIELLNGIGFEMLRYRSYGREVGGKHVLPGDIDAEQIFADDHDLVLRFCRDKNVTTHPRRVVFGLPHNYYFKSSRKNVDISPAGKDYNRRASPLFIHIHRLKANSYAAILALLPASFLPPGVKIKLSSGRHHSATVDCDVDYSVITDFMERPIFSQSKVVVWP
ncbi:MAG: type III-B CRISPR module RAMP protein Cmr1 [Dethiobacteria bacterium]